MAVGSKSCPLPYIYCTLLFSHNHYDNRVSSSLLAAPLIPLLRRFESIHNNKSRSHKLCPRWDEVVVLIVYFLLLNNAILFVPLTRLLSLESQSGRLRLHQTLFVCVAYYWCLQWLCLFHHVNARVM